MANTKVSQLSSLSNIDSTTVFLVSSNTSGTLTSYKTPISSVSTAVLNDLPNYTGNIGQLSFQYANQYATIQGANNSFLKLGGPDDTIFGCDIGNAAVWSNNTVEIRSGIDGINDKIFLFTASGNFTLPANTFAINFANGSQASVPLVDVTNTNGLTTTYYPTFVENRTNGQIVRADVDLSYRTDTNTLTVGNIGVGSVVATANVSTTGYFISGNQATGGFQLGNSNSRLKSGDSNSYMTMGQNPSIFPDTALNPAAGVLIGGSGYLLGNNGSRNITLNYGNSSGVVGLNANLQVGTSGSGTVLVPGTVTTGVNSILAGPSFTPLANTMGGFVSNVNSYTQLTIQNKNTGADATADFIATADNGSDTVNYLDLGIINSGYDANTPTNSLGNIVYAADGYLYAQGNTSNTSQSGGNLVIGTSTSGKNVKIFVGGVNSNSIIANISNTGIAVNGNVTATNFSGNITITGNVTGTSPNVTLVAGNYSYTFDNTGIVTLPAGGGNEGAEIDFTKAPNSTLSGNSISVDTYVDKFRIFESGGTNRGVYIDLTQAEASVGTLLNNRVGAASLALNTSLTFDNLAIQIKTQSSGVWIFAATVSGTATYQYAITYQLAGGGSAQGTVGTMSATTTPATVGSAAWFFSTAASQATVTISDTTNNKMYRVTWQTTTAVSPYGNFVSIERLV